MRRRVARLLNPVARASARLLLRNVTPQQLQPKPPSAAVAKVVLSGNHDFTAPVPWSLRLISAL